MKFLIATLIVLASVAQADIQPHPALYAVVGVPEGGALEVRRIADASAESIGSFAHDATNVPVIGLAEGGTWAQVNIDSIGAGYVPVKNLVRVENGAWSDMVTPFSCSGSEPYWGVYLEPAQMMASYSAGVDIDEDLPMSKIWSQNGWPQGFDPDAPVAIRFSDRNALAFLTPGACSDGASDFYYGISIHLFVTDSDGAEVILSGCCSMAP